MLSPDSQEGNGSGLNEQSPKPKSSQRFPSASQWRRLPAVLSRKEKLLLILLSFSFFSSLVFLIQNLYEENTRAVPAQGGQLIEGIVGTPRFINPVYAEANDADRDLAELIFSGLLRYNRKGELEGDLASDYAIEEDGKVFVVDLREDVRWHDGVPFGAEDVIFTIETIQDPKYKSPIRANWVGVEVEKVSDFRVRFKIREPYAPFPERLTQKIIPSHIWRDISPENFPLSPFNLKPIGTGPYILANLVQEDSGAISRIELQANKQYHRAPPLLSALILRFFENEEALLQEAFDLNLDAFSLVSPEHISKIQHLPYQTHPFTLPRYFAVFFNLNPPEPYKLIRQNNIRKALVALTDKETLTSEVLEGYGGIVSSPLLPELFGFDPVAAEPYDSKAALSLFETAGYTKENGVLVSIPTASGAKFQSELKKGSTGEEVRLLQECLSRYPDVYPEAQVTGQFGSLTEKAVVKFQEKYAQDILIPAGLKRGTGMVGPSSRTKLNELCFPPNQERIPLQLTLATVDQFPLNKTARLLEKQWEEFGVQVDVLTYSAAELERDILKSRNYQMLLFGEILGRIPDPFPFWHSSQKDDPGLNLSRLENEAVDKLLEKVRKEMDANSRLQLSNQLQEEILKQIPALFLYDMSYTYVASPNIQGIQPQVIADPSKRFTDITEWYMETKRVWR